MLELLESRWLPNNLLGALQPAFPDADAPTAYALTPDDPMFLPTSTPDAGAPVISFTPAVQVVTPSAAAPAPVGIGGTANPTTDVTANTSAGIDDALAQALTFWDVSPQANGAADSLAGIQPPASRSATPSAAAAPQAPPPAAAPNAAPAPAAPAGSGGSGGSGAPAAPGGLSVAVEPQFVEEGAAATSNVIASFNDSDGNSNEGFTATVDWGDGTGTQPAGIGGDSDTHWVTGGHSYAEEGTYTMTVTVTGSDGDAGSSSATVMVSDALLSGSGASIGAAAGQSFTAAAATFTDADPNGAVGDYSATVWWGDGASSPGTVVAASGGFEVDGTHTYASAGTYTTVVAFTDVGGASTDASGTAAVSGSDGGGGDGGGGGGLGGGDGGSGGLGGQTLNLVEGAAPASTVVATFTDPDGNTDPTQYQATVNWGDGTPTQTATVYGGSGTFQVEAGHTYTEEGTYTAVVTVVDSDGAEGTVQDTTTVADAALLGSNAPDATVAAGASFTAPVAYFNDADPNGELSDYSAIVTWGDGSSSQGTVVLAPSGGPDTFEVDGTHAYAAAGPYAVSVAIGDVGGSTTNANLTITAANLPYVVNPGNQTNVVGDSVALGVSAGDADGDSLTFSAAGLPPGLSIDPGSGYITGTITGDADSGSPYNVTVSASDGTNSASQTFSWTVSHFSIPNPGDQANAVGDVVNLFTGGSDPDGDALTFSTSNLPPGLSIDPASGTITGTIGATADAGSPYAVTLTASDGTHTASQTFNWTVTHIFVVNPGPQVNADGDAVNLPISARDNDGDTLTYSATGLPPGLSINSVGDIVGTISGTANVGSPYSVTVSASDGTYTTSVTFPWTVSHLLVSDPGDQTNYDGDVVSLQITATDNAQETVAFSAAGLPPGLGINGSTGLISGSISNNADQGGPYTTTVTASAGGYSNSQTFTWTVCNPITLIGPAEENVIQDSPIDLQFGGTDESGGTVTYSAVNLPAGLTINQATGEITGAAANLGTYASTILATDGTFSNSLAVTWNVLAGVVAVPAQSVSVTTTQADVFSGAFGAYAVPLRFQLANPSPKGGYIIVHVYYHHDIDAPAAALRGLALHVDSDVYIALHVSAGNTTPDNPSLLYPNTAAGAVLAGVNHWNTMTNAANQQLQNVKPPPTADLWARLPWMDTKSSGGVTIDGDVFFLEGATQNDLVKIGLFANGTAPGLEGQQLLRQAADFGAIQEKLVQKFNGTPDAAYGLTVNWNADTSGGATQVKIQTK